MDKLGDAFLDFNLNETTIDDQNLNAVWVELDRGLLSDNTGQQCESILKLTELFDKYPLPVFVNSGFLRLARIFQNGNNYLKLQVIRVIEKNHKHLHKILNLDEILKLIFYNIHSNDSICRALTLRALGGISSIISDKHNVQHSIRLALESHDEMEAKEAIMAANKFCSVSQSFAASLFERIAEMIEDMQSPLDRKMKLIPLLVHMHHDVELSHKVKNVCKSMFFSFPRADISRIILNTLTQIACQSLPIVNETIDFLIRLLNEEPREKILVFLLMCLNALAQKCSHLWTASNIDDLIKYTSAQANNSTLLLKSSEILCILAKEPSINHMFIRTQHKELEMNGTLKELIESMCFHAQMAIAFNFCLLSTKILAWHHVNQSRSVSNCNVHGLFGITTMGLYAIITELSESMSDETSQLKYLKNSLKCTVDLARLDFSAQSGAKYLNELYAFTSDLLHLSMKKSNAQHTNTTKSSLYCETLLALCRFEPFDHNVESSVNLERKQTFIQHLFLNELNKSNENDVDAKNQLDLQLKLINLLFELEVRKTEFVDEKYDPNQISDETAKTSSCLLGECVSHFLRNKHSNGWLLYKLARMCARYAYFSQAVRIYSHLRDSFVSYKCFNTNDLLYKCWLDFVGSLCQAEHCLCARQSDSSSIDQLTRNLNESMRLYANALSIFKSSCVSRTQTNAHMSNSMLESVNVCFQQRYCELRSEQCKLYLHVLMSSMTWFTQPAPLFQFKSSDNLAKLGRIAQQMRYALNELQKLITKYKEFIAECFDADSHSINILNMLKKHNECLSFCINVLNSSKVDHSILNEFNAAFLSSNCSEQTSELKMDQVFYAQIGEKLRSLLISQEANESKIEQIKQFQQILVDFIRFPVPLPRAFFNIMQKTQIKLITSPLNKRTNPVHAIRIDQPLVFKIDGLISQVYKSKKPIRTVKKIQLCLNCELDTKAMPDAKGFILPKYSDTKVITEEPKNDYFNANFQINFPYYGNYSVQLDLTVFDESNCTWKYRFGNMGVVSLQVA